MDRWIHRGLQALIVGMISLTSIGAYHFWWKQRHHWHRVVQAETEYAALPLRKGASEVTFKQERRSVVDWLNVLADAGEKGMPIASLVATLWLDRRRKEFAVKADAKRARLEPRKDEA